MKLGAVFVVYLLFGIWTSTNRIGNVLLIIAGLFAICLLISALGWLIRSDKMVSFGNRNMKRLAITGILGLITMFTWKPLLNLIF